MLGVQLIVSRIKDTFGVKLTLRQLLFNSPTVAALAAEVARASGRPIA